MILLLSEYSEAWVVNIIYWWFASDLVLQSVASISWSGDNTFFDKGYMILFCHLIFHYFFIFCLRGIAASVIHAMFSVALNLFPLQCMHIALDQPDGATSQVFAMTAVGPGGLSPITSSLLEFRPVCAFSDLNMFGCVFVETKQHLISTWKTKHNPGKVVKAMEQSAYASVSPETEIRVFPYDLMAQSVWAVPPFFSLFHNHHYFFTYL